MFVTLEDYKVPYEPRYSIYQRISVNTSVNYRRVTRVRDTNVALVFESSYAGKIAMDHAARMKVICSTVPEEAGMPPANDTPKFRYLTLEEKHAGRIYK